MTAHAQLGPKSLAGLHPQGSHDRQMRDPFTPAAKPGALSCARAEAVTNEFCCLESLMTLQEPELTMPILQK